MSVHLEEPTLNIKLANQWQDSHTSSNTRHNNNILNTHLLNTLLQEVRQTCSIHQAHTDNQLLLLLRIID